MKPVEELQFATPALAVWQAYSPEVKVDCTSTALATPAGWLLVDPIPLADSCVEELTASWPLAGIALTSTNHQRASLDLRERFSLPIYAPHAPDLIADIWLKPGDTFCEDVRVLSMLGAASGEIALLSEPVLILGDAVINLGELAILPDKYCEDPRQLRISIQALADHHFGMACFAHGLPIVTNAPAQILRLN
jgi:hypothetical protein